MARYPRPARDAALKCISCNAPVTRTVNERHVYVNCGESPSESRAASDGAGTVADD